MKPKERNRLELRRIEQRLKAWFDGELTDADLSPVEVEELNKRVFKALTDKLVTVQKPGDVQ